jgi:hypothetical protein
MECVGLVFGNPLSGLAHELRAHSSTTSDLPFIVLLYFWHFSLCFSVCCCTVWHMPHCHVFLSTSPSSQTSFVYTAPFSYGRLCFNCIRHRTILCLCPCFWITLTTKPPEGGYWVALLTAPKNEWTNIGSSDIDYVANGKSPLRCNWSPRMELYHPRDVPVNQTVLYSWPVK